MRRSHFLVIALCILTCSIAGEACRIAEPVVESENQEILSGGTETVFATGAGAFGVPFPMMTGDNGYVHTAGDAGFSSQYVPAPATIRPGLGPIYNNNACSSCHIGDGRGKPPAPGEQLTSLLMRISIPGTGPHGGPNPVPGFGDQLQQRAVAGIQPEADVHIDYTTQTFSFPDGSTYELSTPHYHLDNPYIPLPSGVMVSPRVAPPVFGLGLLEAIPETEIVAHAGPQDDGTNGQANYVWDADRNTMTLGRFGWKAGQPTILQQTAGAFNQDMGITNRIFPVKSCHGQIQGANEEYNDVLNVTDSMLYAVAFYMKTLAVPARRNMNDPEVAQGKIVFTEAGCASCHTPMHHTAINVAFPELSNQTIFPYTDLLLHDMGPGLADNRPEFAASGQQWKTPPLWGIGLTKVVNGHNNFLHDGRARSLLEAIMWHGGEAEPAKKYVASMSTADRKALIAFLNSL